MSGTMQQPGYPDTHSLTLFEVLSVATFGGILLVTASMVLWAVAT